MLAIDRLIMHFDQGLRTLFAPARTVRGMPGEDLPEPALTEDERHLAGALMRVNHAGEVCAQALYQGQAMTAREPRIQTALEKAAWDETEHLAWCERRIAALGGRKSVLNPLWYGASLAVGAAAGALGDQWNLGFLAETERQVERHLERHLARLPREDAKSQAVLQQMKLDERGHADTARALGGAPLPLPVTLAMKLGSKVMTKTAFWV
ncbi:MAG: 2-polyprenyl-3-methyl-6-methoxy-1,4-benzoquinone monooxygenase [Betaproteobacteria bacterium]|nr:2-polyprenyl-3-methyl-6-methoxy-1,4-benzoquinone monooxygenase [Betaproteobacteria bacterium]